MDDKTSRAGSPVPLVLASGSPRRRELLGTLGLTFDVAPADVDESRLAGEPPRDYAVRLSERKAAVAAVGMTAGFTIGADTIVVLDDEVLGKPADAAAAASYLRRLRGREHHVITGVAVACAATGRIVSGSSLTRVWMRSYTEDEIAAYVESGDPFDKAGAYAIQHTGFDPVARLEGSRSNVIGLPLALTAELLSQFGVSSGNTSTPTAAVRA